MANPTVTGEWFVPGGEHRFPGRLIHDDLKKEVRLELFAEKYIDGADVANFKNNNFARFHDIALGESGGKVTLYKVRWSGSEKIGKDFFLINYSAEFAIYGVHLAKKEALLVKSGTFQFPHLSSFLDGGTGKHPLEENSWEFPFQQGFKPFDQIPIGDNLSLVVVDQVWEETDADFTRKGKVYQQTLGFSYKKATPFDTMLNDARHFRDMLAFSYGRPQPYRLLDIVIATAAGESSASPKNDAKDLRVSNYSLHKGKEIRQDEKPGYHMTISRWNFDRNEDLVKIIQHWFESRSYAQLFDIYLDSNNWFQDFPEVLISNVMFNNRFLNIIQGLELYHRERLQAVHPDKADFELKKKEVLKRIKDEPKLKQWLNNAFNFKKDYESLERKIDLVVESFDKELNALLSNRSVLDNFSWYGVTQRNKLSHGLQLQTYQGEAMRLFLQIGQLLLCCAILRILGVDDIAGVIKANQGFRDKIALLNIAKIERTEG